MHSLGHWFSPGPLELEFMLFVRRKTISGARIVVVLVLVIKRTVLISIRISALVATLTVVVTLIAVGALLVAVVITRRETIGAILLLPLVSRPSFILAIIVVVVGAFN